MIIRNTKYVLLFLILLENITLAQYGGHDWGIYLGYSYTTTSRLYLNPNSLDPETRDTYIPLDEIFHFSAEVKYKFTPEFAVGLGSEYIETTKSDVNIFVNDRNIQMTVGYRATPILLSAYYLLPFSTQSFKFDMEGGVGFYFADHIREFGDATVSKVSQDFSFGIHVGLGMDYMIGDFLSVRFDLKFRDPEITVISKYDQETVTIDDRVYNLPSESFETKTNIDGTTYSLGLVFHIF